MKKLLNYLSKLNWKGFLIAFLVCAFGGGLNDNITSIEEWFILILIIALPFSLLVLIIGKSI